MSSYHVEVDTAAAREIKRINRADQKRILTKITSLGANPRPQGCVKLSGQDSYRIRVGVYRIIYVIEDAVRVVTVSRVGHRKEVYRK